jgi:hypothetical protein
VEAAGDLSTAEVGLEDRAAGKEVNNFTNARETELRAQKVWVDNVRVKLVHSEEFPGQGLPAYPVYWRVVVVLARQEAHFVGDMEVGLRLYEAGVRVEEAQGDSQKFHPAPNVAATKIPLEKKARDGLDEEPPLVGPEEVQAHLVGDGNLSAHGDIKVQRHGGTLFTSKP